MIDGEPRVYMVIQDKVCGDTAAAAIVANAIPTVRAAAPGLQTMRDLSVVTPRQDQ